jgi:membrane-associated protein
MTTPHRGRRITPGQLCCAVGLVLGVVASYVFAGLTPSMLAHHSLLLETLSGSTVGIVTGGALARVGRESLALALLAPLATVALYDAFYWWAGVLWGSRAAEFYGQRNPRLRRSIDRAEDFVRRRGVLALPLANFLPIPNVLVYLFCGTSGMPLWLFLIGDAIGTMLWSGLLVGLGWSAGKHAVHVVNRIQHYAIPITIGLVVVVIVVSALRQRRSGAPAEGAGGVGSAP